MMEARDAGIRVAIATTTSPENLEPLITAGFGSEALIWFDAIAAGDVVARKKPAPDIYNVALKSLGVDPALRNCGGRFGDRRDFGEGGGPFYRGDAEHVDASPGLHRGRSAARIAGRSGRAAGARRKSGWAPTI